MIIPRPRDRKISLGVLMLCVLSLILLACRLETAFSGEPTLTPVRSRAALRPTFTPQPLATDTAVPTPTAVASDTLTPEPPTAVPTEEPTRRPTARPRPTNIPLPPTPVPTAVPPPTPTVVFAWTPSDQSCKALDGAADDRVRGTIAARNAAAVGQRVRASAGPGGEPVSADNLSRSDGIYLVVISCSGSACDGNFWLWMVDANGQQISPFVEFTFDDGCRRGILNFTKTS